MIVRNVKHGWLVWYNENMDTATKRKIISTIAKDLSDRFRVIDNSRSDKRIIKDKDLRLKIISYYKDLKGTIQTEGRRAGSLSKSAKSQTEQKEIADKFIDLCSRATSIRNELSK